MSILDTITQTVETKISPALDQFLKRNWILKTVLLALLLSVVTSAPNTPAILNPPFPQYLEKFQNPSFDIVKSGIPEATQAANTNYRMGVPILFNILHLHHPLALTYLLILSVIASYGVFALISRQIFEDRKLAFIATMYLAVTYNGSFSYPSVTYDQFTLLLIFLTMVRYRWSWVVGIFTFVALWCDERAYPGCLTAMGLHLLWAAHRDKKNGISFMGVIHGFKSVPVIVMLAAYTLAVLTRLWVKAQYDFTIPVGGGAVINAWVMNIRYYHVGTYYFLEGAWIVVLTTLISLYLRGKKGLVGLILCAGIPCTFLGFTVFDISRTFSFIFPAVLVIFFLLKHTEKEKNQLHLLTIVFVVSLIGGNYVIHSHKEGMLRWIRPLPVKLVEDKLMEIREDFFRRQGREDEI